jgi:hypothetical protein
MKALAINAEHKARTTSQESSNKQQEIDYLRRHANSPTPRYQTRLGNTLGTEYRVTNPNEIYIKVKEGHRNLLGTYIPKTAFDTKNN